MSQNVDRVAESIEETSIELAGVAEAAKESSFTSKKFDTAALELQEISSNIQKMFARFKT